MSKPTRGRTQGILLCMLLPLAAIAHSEVKAPLGAMAEWEAHGRAEGLARPDTPCQDFLAALGRKPDSLHYLGCDKDDDSYLKPMTARYAVSGAAAAEVEAYLRQRFDMPSLVYVCCGWGSEPHAWREGPDGVRYDIGMGVESPSFPREHWDRIPSFGVTVGVIRQSP
ncbi:DUF4952 domain-containing protein [Stenotrophomonas sp. JAG2]|uniref:DUF4952 domain-containing protein n=1 Tax=Stenotrophomonas sp. JAG2 TaxID=3229243 RepID=UPI0034E220E3